MATTGPPHTDLVLPLVVDILETPVQQDGASVTKRCQKLVKALRLLLNILHLQAVPHLCLLCMACQS